MRSSRRRRKLPDCIVNMLDVACVAVDRMLGRYDTFGIAQPDSLTLAHCGLPPWKSNESNESTGIDAHIQYPRGPNGFCSADFRPDQIPLVQEREAKKDTWKPRWFRANPDGPVFDGEHPADKCPLWDFTGDAFQLPKRPVQPDGAVDIDAECFDPGSRAKGAFMRAVALCLEVESCVRSRPCSCSSSLLTSNVASAVALARPLSNQRHEDVRPTC